jgi:hypothetical protein
MNAPHLEQNTPEGAATVPAPAVAEAAPPPPPVTLATLAGYWRTLGYAQASVTCLADVLTAMETPCGHCGAVGPWKGLRAVPFYRPGRSALFPGDPRHREPSMRVAMVCRQCQAAEEL